MRYYTIESHYEKEAPFKIPKEISIEEIKNIKELFINAAFRAKEADYDAIELHAAHGYLLCEFLSPISNNRTDKKL